MKGYVLSFKGERGQEVFAAGERLGFWPAGATWWFAWNELEIHLPALLVDPGSAFDARWDAARIFAGAAELRWERQGRERVARLLIEDEATTGYRTDWCRRPQNHPSRRKRGGGCL